MMQQKKWWHDKIVYQIYPMSFADANNDGYGDLKGIIQHLDDLKELGVDILWLTPFFASPMEDNGYDVANYYQINPLFGTMKDMDTLIAETKKREMYIMMDIVANHTSSEHDWFKESKKSKDNPYREYYIWRDEPLFNMHSTFGGSAWEYDENTKQYYFHEFGVGQPDLNWENKKIMDEFVKIINFWMEKGIRGIRFDVIQLIGKEIDKDIHAYGPTLHSKVRELNLRSFGRYDAVTVGEAWGDLEKAIEFTNPEHHELDMVFQFECTSSTCDYTRYHKFTPKPINMKWIKDILCKYQRGLNDLSWNALFVENHDLGRCINKFGNEKEFYLESAKAIAIMNYFLKGTPFIYQGQEIGMTNIVMNSIDEYRDIEIKGHYQELVLDKKVLTYDEFMKACYQEGRDNNRTPIQWDDSVNAGFNKGATPWIKVNPNYQTINLKAAKKDSNSIYHFYKKLIQLRKNETYKNTFVYGKFQSYLDDLENVFVYTRSDQDNQICIVVNMNRYEETITLPFHIEKVLLQNYESVSKMQTQTLRPYEAFVYTYKK